MGIDWDNRTETCDFWIGVFRDEETVSEYFGESEDYYQFLDDGPATVKLTPKGGAATDGRTPLTKFLADHNQEWYDHDMVELGFSMEAQSVAELVEPYSYSDQYADRLTRLAADANIGCINTFFFIRVGEIREPRSTDGDGFVLKYVGQITYNI